jgi:agmatine/peptidylarginine deiminase
VKLSAKLVTALAALALVAVAVAGLIGTSNDVRADVNATISLDKSWYTATGAVKVTIQDADRDTSTAATTNFTFTALGGVTQFFDLDDNLADSDGDGVIDSSDFAI